MNISGLFGRGPKASRAPQHHPPPSQPVRAAPMAIALSSSDEEEEEPGQPDQAQQALGADHKRVTDRLSARAAL